jgi:hypothetical protein
MKKIVISIMMGLSGFTSCSDEEFLQRYPHSITDHSLYTTVDDATQGLLAAYDVLQLGEQVERIELFGTVCSGDALAGGQPGGSDYNGLESYMRFQVAASGQQFTGPQCIGVFTVAISCYNIWMMLNLLLIFLKIPVSN